MTPGGQFKYALNYFSFVLHHIENLRISEDLCYNNKAIMDELIFEPETSFEPVKKSNSQKPETKNREPKTGNPKPVKPVEPKTHNRYNRSNRKLITGTTGQTRRVELGGLFIPSIGAP